MTERRCLWCYRTPSEAAASGLHDKSMTFANGNRNCPCNFCANALSKRHGGASASGAAAAFVPARKKGYVKPRPPKASE